MSEANKTNHVKVQRSEESLQQIKRFYVHGDDAPQSRAGMDVVETVDKHYWNPVDALDAEYSEPNTDVGNICAGCVFQCGGSPWDNDVYCDILDRRVSRLGSCKYNIQITEQLGYYLKTKGVEAKTEDRQQFELGVEIVRAEVDEQDRRLTYGVVYAPDELDSHGTFMREEDIEYAAHNFMEYSRTMGDEHNALAPGAVVVESYIAPQDMNFTDIAGELQTVPKGSWILVQRVDDDDYWAEIKAGEKTGYSIHGMAVLLDEQIDAA